MSPRWLSALAVLAGCGGPSTAETTPAGEETRPQDESGRPPVADPAIRTKPGETLAAAVVRPVALRETPSPDSAVVARVGRRTEFDSPTVMAVMRRRGSWLGVAAAELPNGRLGWVLEDRVKLLREPWSIEVDLSERRAVLKHRGEEYRSFPVAVGAPGTDTPPGRYGVTDRLSTGGAGSPYGCCVLALTGHQPDVPQDWPGGDRLAIHGTTAPATIGRAASNGCLRAGERTMRLLIAKVPLGAQVVVRR